MDLIFIQTFSENPRAIINNHRIRCETLHGEVYSYLQHRRYITHITLLLNFGDRKYIPFVVFGTRWNILN